MDAVPRRRTHTPAQLTFKLERPSANPLPKLDPQGLVEALASLLLEAAGAAIQAAKEGEDER
jgi:hypothetical protein